LKRRIERSREAQSAQGTPLLRNLRGGVVGNRRRCERRTANVESERRAGFLACPLEQEDVPR